MFTLQDIAKNPISDSTPEVPGDLFEAMWQIFVAIGRFWGNMADPAPHRIQLYNFMINRIKLYPIYRAYYATAKLVMEELTGKYGADEGYRRLFTDNQADIENPPQSALALTRQMVSNQFVALQLSLGGFKAYGALNYCGYPCGPYIPGVPAPYRT